MPELPDVETFRRYMAATSLGRPIARVRVLDARVLEGASPRRLCRVLEGRAFRRAERHGKVLFAEADSVWLALRFGMTGFLRAYRDAAPPGAHERVIFDFQSGEHLAFDCQRMFGRVSPISDPEDFIRERDLGPDAGSIARDEFSARVGGHRGALKSALTDQSALAGIGNVYADEILFQARHHPRTPARALPPKELDGLHRVTGRVLERAIEAGADPGRMPRTWITPRRRKGASCPRCGAQLDALSIGGRTAYACPRCQPSPR